MIVEVKDYYILYKLAALIDKGVFKNIDYTAEDFLRYLIENTESDKIKVFADIENSSIKGFVVCSLAKDIVRDKPQVFIDLAYVEPKSNGTGKHLMDKVENYAKLLNIDEISGYSLKGERGMFKKYGFDLDYRVFVKRLGGKDEK